MVQKHPRQTLNIIGGLVDRVIREEPIRRITKRLNTLFEDAHQVFTRHLSLACRSTSSLNSLFALAYQLLAVMSTSMPGV